MTFKILHAGMVQIDGKEVPYREIPKRGLQLYRSDIKRWTKATPAEIYKYFKKV